MAVLKRSLSNDAEVTTVIDAGARYGMHPSWRAFGGPLRYFGFEPDKREVERLQHQSQPPAMEIIACGLGKKPGSRKLRLASHRGCSSFLKVNPRSEWFGRYRRGEGSLESIVHVPTCAIDNFADDRKIKIDFLKVDTEGTELEVIEGAKRELARHVLGARVNVNFRAAYKHQALFADIHAYLTRKDFVLLNLDYFGRGIPRYGLFRNPDPLSLDVERYGVLVATDGVWVREYDWICDRYRNNHDLWAYTTLKYAYFCTLNHAVDVGLDALMRFVTRYRMCFDTQVKVSGLYIAVRKTLAMFLGRWRVHPNDDWKLARHTFSTIFGIELKGGSKYWELVQSL